MKNKKKLYKGKNNRSSQEKINRKKEEIHLNILGGKQNYQIQGIMWIYIKQFKEIKDKVNVMVKGKSK